MSDSSTAEQSWSWWKPGIADVLFLLAALAVLRGAQHTLLDDPGLGWHLRNLDAMWQKGGWLTVDPFTDPRGEEPARWYSNQWLGEIPLYLGWKWAGLEGIAVVNAVIIAVLARLLYHRLLLDTGNWAWSLVWTTLALMGTSCSWNARPNLFTILFLFYTADFCVRQHAHRVDWKSRLGLLVVFILWANTHGGFLAGLLTLGLTLGIELSGVVLGPDPKVRHQALRRSVEMLATVAAAFLATLINPYGIELYRWTFALLGNPFFMELHQEWRSPDFRGAGAIRFESLILLFPLVLALTSRKTSAVELALSLFWLHMALTGFRYVALWVVVAVPVMARASVQIPLLQDLARRWQIGTQPGSLFYTPAGSSGWLYTVLLSVGLMGWARWNEGNFAFHSQKIIATAAMDQLLVEARRWQQERGQRPVILHSYDWGGYLTWHGWPALLNWIDDRNEVQGKQRIEEYFTIVRADPGWEKKLEQVDLICLSPTMPLSRELGRQPDTWREQYRDEYGVVFVRKRGRA